MTPPRRQMLDAMVGARHGRAHAGDRCGFARPLNTDYAT